MADHMEEEERTREEPLPGIGELKTFSQVRRPGLIRAFVFSVFRHFV